MSPQEEIPANVQPSCVKQANGPPLSPCNYKYMYIDRSHVLEKLTDKLSLP